MAKSKKKVATDFEKVSDKIIKEEEGVKKPSKKKDNDRFYEGSEVSEVIRLKLESLDDKELEEKILKGEKKKDKPKAKGKTKKQESAKEKNVDDDIIAKLKKHASEKDDDIPEGFSKAFKAIITDVEELLNEKNYTDFAKFQKDVLEITSKRMTEASSEIGLASNKLEPIIYQLLDDLNNGLDRKEVIHIAIKKIMDAIEKENEENDSVLISDILNKAREAKNTTDAEEEKIKVTEPTVPAWMNLPKQADTLKQVRAAKKQLADDVLRIHDKYYAGMDNKKDEKVS